MVISLLSYFVLNPLLLVTLLRGTPTRIKFVECCAIFGYSMSCFVVAAVVSLIPLVQVRIAVTVWSAYISLFFVYKEFKELLVEHLAEQKLKYVKIYALASMVCLMLLLQYYFF